MKKDDLESMKTMRSQQDKFLLPDKSFWQALNSKQREVLISKYTILCPPILLTEIAKGEFGKFNAMLNMKNIFAVPIWSERAKKELITGISFEPIPFTNDSATKSIFDRSKQDISALKESASKFIDALKDREDNIQNLSSIVGPQKEKLLSLINNTDNLSKEEWLNKLKEIGREYQPHYPEMEQTLNKIDVNNFSHEQVTSVKASLKALCESFETDSLVNSYQVATNLLHHEPGDQSRAYEILQRLCTLLSPILTQEERTQIFNRFLKENMPSISKFAPYTLGAMAWRLTIHLFLRENPKDSAPRGGALKDAEYMLYTCYANIYFVSSDKWHRKFMNEIPLFKGGLQNFTFVDNTTKETIQEGVSKLVQQYFTLEGMI